MVGPKSELNYLYLIEDPPSLFSRPSVLLYMSPAFLPESLGPFHSPALCPQVYPGPTRSGAPLLGHLTSTGLMTVSFVLSRWQLCSWLRSALPEADSERAFECKWLIVELIAESPGRECGGETDKEGIQSGRPSGQFSALGLSQFWETSEYSLQRGAEAKGNFLLKISSPGGDFSSIRVDIQGGTQFISFLPTSLCNH